MLESTSCCRSTSNLTVLTKIIEKAVFQQLYPKIKLQSLSPHPHTDGSPVYLKHLQTFTDFSSLKDVNSILSNQFRIFWLPEIWIKPDELNGSFRISSWLSLGAVRHTESSEASNNNSFVLVMKKLLCCLKSLLLIC